MNVRDCMTASALTEMKCLQVYLICLKTSEMNYFKWKKKEKKKKRIPETVCKQAGNETTQLEQMNDLYPQKAFVIYCIILPHHIQVFASDVL